MSATLRALGGPMLALTIGAGAAWAGVPESETKTSEPQRPAFLLRIDGRDAFFDLGRSSGAGPGDRVRVLRTVRAINPATGEPVEDRFLVGEVEIAEAGEVLSRARPDPELLRQLKLGDLVELARLRPDPRLPAARLLSASEEPASCPPAAAPSPEAEDALGFREAWLKAQPLSPQVRALHWSKWIEGHPTSAVTAAVRREIAALKSERETEIGPGGAAQKVVLESLRAARVVAPTHGFAGDPIELVLAFAEPADGAAAPRAATLNWRPRGEPLFRSIAFTPSDSRNWRARLPQEAAQEPGLDWYVELVGTKGGEQSISGDSSRPIRIDIQKAPGTDDSARKERSRAGLWVDFVDWNHLKGNDQHYNVEGEFLYRVLGPLHSIRMGFGLYQGWGESLSDSLADERAANGGSVAYRAKRVGYNYGFTELEFHPAEWIGLMSKLLSGVNRDGFLMGVAGALRIGREQGTSLTLSTGFTPGIGNRNEISLAWDQVQGFPMAASVIVSNEPVQADYGVRFVYQVGRKITDFYDVSLRASYQLRDINHNGFGLGLAQSFHW